MMARESLASNDEISQSISRGIFIRATGVLSGVSQPRPLDADWFGGGTQMPTTPEHWTLDMATLLRPVALRLMLSCSLTSSSPS